ncbi:hypothetical protein SAMN05444162_1143 [Paenibacillaceae bacterium GAS479]|nr:hypothetical protein SAMN05444162_1143 [Paenibacillaceae bacterium GAS479]
MAATGQLFHCVRCEQMLGLQAAAKLFQTGFYRSSQLMGCCSSCSGIGRGNVSASFSAEPDVNPLIADASSKDNSRFVDSACTTWFSNRGNGLTMSFAITPSI